RRERQREMRVAVAELRDEQIVADQKRRFHRAGGNAEGLEQEGADHERDQQRLHDHPRGFDETAALLGGFGLAHGGGPSFAMNRAGWPRSEQEGFDAGRESAIGSAFGLAPQPGPLTRSLAWASASATDSSMPAASSGRDSMRPQKRSTTASCAA